jgi:uncharacterized membrane protein (UPF0127 family)
MRVVTIHNRTHLLKRAIQARFCNTFFCRLQGLMFQPGIPTGQGLLLVENKDSRMDASIHMFFCNFDLAIIWINSHNQVVDKCLARRWRPFYMPKSPACYILETHPDSLDEFQIGDVIELHDVKIY